MGAAIWLVVRANLRVRRAEQAAEEAHSIKNDFVAMVSHELRTPLTSIAGFADTLISGWRDLPESEVDEFLHYIHKQSLYLGDLVEDVLVIPRLEAGRMRFRPEMFDLGKVVHDVTELLVATDSSRDVVVSMPTGVMVEADPKRVQQVIRNLLENARKYGGEQILVEGFGYGDHYVIVVADNGPGVTTPSKDLRALRAAIQGRRPVVIGYRFRPAHRPPPRPGHGRGGVARASVPHRQPLLFLAFRCRRARRTPGRQRRPDPRVGRAPPSSGLGLATE